LLGKIVIIVGNFQHADEAGTEPEKHCRDSKEDDTIVPLAIEPPPTTSISSIVCCHDMNARKQKSMQRLNRLEYCAGLLPNLVLC
jgi:hypothetical protein